MSDLRLAWRLAEIADRLALRYFRGHLTPWVKDGELITHADLEIEYALVRTLSFERPQDSILTEHSGPLWMASRRWVIDPIDATSSYLAGEPGWGTQIALEIDGRPEIAVVTRPCGRCRWWAARGQGAFRLDAVTPSWPGRRVRLSTVDPYTWPDDGWPPAALLAGRAHTLIDEGGRRWNRAPAALVVTEAGGQIHDPAGGHSLDLAWLVYTNGTAPAESLLAAKALRAARTLPNAAAMSAISDAVPNSPG